MLSSSASLRLRRKAADEAPRGSRGASSTSIEGNAVTSPDENVTDFYDSTINTTNITTNTTADEYYPNEEDVDDSLEFSAGQAIFIALEVYSCTSIVVRRRSER